MNVLQFTIVATVLLAGIVVSGADDGPDTAGIVEPPEPSSHDVPPIDDDQEEPPLPLARDVPPRDPLVLKKRSITKRSACRDIKHKCLCNYYKLRGYCDVKTYPGFQDYMTRYCQATCRVCTPAASAGSSCTNTIGERTCNSWVQHGYQNNPRYQFTMACRCPKACGLCDDNPAPDEPAENLEQTCVQWHNFNRTRHHNAVALQWDQDSADYAAFHAGRLAQSGRGSYHSSPSQRTWPVDQQNVLHGENIYERYASSASAAPISCKEAIEYWYAERPLYNPNNPLTNFRAAAHFTQLVWKATLKVGCAVHNNFFVCIYEPTGNIYSTSAIRANVDP